ncbi:MAG: glucosyltransferase domain-containing protein [Spirochaetaceae bacterium]|nr:glucosyltransferase domain-containing protein [Spirochaetaceae bacterium]
MKAIDYFGTEKASLSGFCSFCKKNSPLVISATMALFFTYGCKLFWYTIGVDTERYMAGSRTLFWDEQETILFWGGLGRFGLIVFQKLWYIKEFNPYTAFFTAFCFIWLFTISWCYIIAVFSKNTNRNNRFIPFALLFMTAPIWAEQFYFVCQAAEVSCIVFLCPYVIYLLYSGFLENKRKKIIVAFMLLIFMTSVYQGIVPLFCCGVFACFLILYENSDYEQSVYHLLCLKLFLILIASLIAYTFLDYFFVTVVFNTEKVKYFSSLLKNSSKQNIINLLLYGYTITIGATPLIQNVAEPIMARFARSGMQAAKHITAISRISGNPLALPLVILFIIEIVKTTSWAHFSKKKYLYILAGISVPVSIIILPVLQGGTLVIRGQFVLPFALSFMLFFLMKKYKKIASSMVWFLALITAVYNAELTAQLFYSDYIRYQSDIHLAMDIDKEVTPLQDDTKSIPVALIGKYKLTFKNNFISGEALGNSSFAWASQGFYESTRHGLPFMQSLGINYNLPDERLMNQARTAAASMPSYPASGSVKRLPDVIVVKLSDSTYVEIK